MVPYGHLKKYTILFYRQNQRLCLQSTRYKFCNLTSFIRPLRKIKNINNISLKFIMLTDNNQIFRNWFVIIHRYLTKVSAQIIQCIIFERKELSITLFTLWLYSLGSNKDRIYLPMSMSCKCYAGTVATAYRVIIYKLREITR